MKSIIFSAIGLIGATYAQKDASDPFLGENWKSGIVDFNSDDNMFYWQFYSRRNKDTDPVVMWLTGGPGCSSELATYFENGPFGFDKDHNVTSNDHSWNNIANLLYVDNPIGTGFS